MSFFNKKPNNCDKKLEKFEKKAPIWSHFSPSSVDISKVTIVGDNIDVI